MEKMLSVLVIQLVVVSCRTLLDTNINMKTREEPVTDKLARDKTLFLRKIYPTISSSEVKDLNLGEKKPHILDLIPECSFTNTCRQESISGEHKHLILYFVPECSLTDTCGSIVLSKSPSTSVQESQPPSQSHFRPYRGFPYFRQTV